MSILKEFIKESNHDFNKLITLSRVIEDLNNYVDESDGNEKRAWMLITLYKKALEQPLTLGDFIPCDSEGKPIKRPIKNRKDHSLNGHNQYTKALEAYQSAKDAVIFEGFEIHKGDNPEWNCFGSSDYLISGFHCDSNEPNVHIAAISNIRDIKVIGEGLTTRADLATATKSNPLTLKTETK